MRKIAVQSSLQELQDQFLEAIVSIQNTQDLEKIKVRFLGKKSPLQDFMKKLKEQSPLQRPLIGKQINELKEFIVARCIELEQQLIAKEEKEQLAEEKVDSTLPGRRRCMGRKHPLTQGMNEILSILVEMGFSIQSGPDIDTDYYNFEALNFSSDHPAREMQDTYYLSPHLLLRTHTSTIQARIMERNKPPIRIIAPGKVYRNEDITARSHVFFHQIDAVYIDRQVTVADLLATFDIFLAKVFKKPILSRYRPSYFPFVEPGIEIDIRCLICEGKGCTLCKHTGWVEIAGAGMIHPEVLKNGGIDPEEYSGFAWGLGLERLIMLLRGIQDIRLFTENNLRFLKQFTDLP
jgi:phenylalanyl-tRNA synthetase alpha chain